MIITAKNGERLTLTATRLTQIDYSTTDYPFHITKADLKAAFKSALDDGGWQEILVRGRAGDGSPNSVHVKFSSLNGRIGCENFTEATFNKILKTMGLKKKESK